MEKKIQIDNKIIGQRIRMEREKLELTREELAEIVGISDYYIGQLERGERQMSLPVMIKIANCLHVSLDYLIFGKTPCDSYYAHDAQGVYDACSGDKDTEINSLLNKCSPKELELIKKIIKVILPYI